MTAPRTIAAGLSEAQREAVLTFTREIDEWLARRCERIVKAHEPFIMKGGDLDDPQYRVMLGHSHAYHRVPVIFARRASLFDGG